MVLVSSPVLRKRRKTQRTALIILWYFEEIVPPADLIRFFCSLGSKPGENIQTYWLAFKVNNSDVPLGSKNLLFQPWNKMLIIDFFFFWKQKSKDGWHIFAGTAFSRPFVAFYMPFVAFNGEIKAWNNNTNRKSQLGNSSGLQSLHGCLCLRCMLKLLHFPAHLRGTFICHPFTIVTSD